MKLSFILPTCRNPNDYGNKVINNINEVFSQFEKEIVVCAPFKFPGNVISVLDPPGEGCVRAINFAYKNSTGDVIVGVADDQHFEKSGVKVIDLLKSNKFANRIHKVVGIRGWTGTPCRLPWYIKKDFNVVPFFAIERETIERWGGLIYPTCFKLHYGDNWMGYWLGSEGEPVIECEETKMIRCDNHATINAFDSVDEFTFKKLVDDYESGNKKYLV